jgi:acyl carrier protein
MQNKDTIISIIKEVINEKKIDINSESNHFKRWDSLANINIALKIEKKFKIKVKASDMENMNSVKKIVKILNVI